MIQIDNSKIEIMETDRAPLERVLRIAEFCRGETYIPP